MARCLVFGGSVFVGRTLVRKLIEEGHDVYVLNRGNHLPPEGAKQLLADRNIIGELSKVLSGLTFDVVFDGSAYTVEQTRLAISCLRENTSHFIHISSAAVYSKSQDFPIYEDYPRGPNDDWGDYSIQKFLCEEELFRAWSEFAFPITIFRPFYIYGPGNNLERESYIFRRLIHESQIVVPGDGQTRIQFGHVDDLVSAMIQVINNENTLGQAYNISGDNYVTFTEWIETCARVVGIKPRIIYLGSREIGYQPRQWFPFRNISLFGSCNKLKESMRIQPRYTLLEGLHNTFKYMETDQLMQLIVIPEVEQRIIRVLGNNEPDIA